MRYNSRTIHLDPQKIFHLNALIDMNNVYVALSGLEGYFSISQESLKSVLIYCVIVDPYSSAQAPNTTV